MNNLSINTWHHYKYNLKNRVLTLVGLSKVCADFNNNILKQIPTNEAIMVQMKICLKNGTFKSISTVEIYTSAQLEQISEFFTSNWSLKNEYYHQFEIHYVIISYKIIKQSEQANKKLLKKVISSDCFRAVQSNPSFSFEGYNLPTTMDRVKEG
jgi:ABC-type enterochelin transport system permease subunit